MVDRGSRLRAAAELHEVGIALMRGNLRRRSPELDENGIAELVRTWLQDRPLDAPGPPRLLSRD